MNSNKTELHFSFWDGLLSVFFGSRHTRIRNYYSTLKGRSDNEALISDFKKVGGDMRKVMKVQSKKHELELESQL